MKEQNKLWDLKLKVNVLRKTLRKLYFLILIIIPFINSCSQQKDLTGTYTNIQKPSEALQIMSDSTFSFISIYGSVSNNTIGKWKITSDKEVILNSIELNTEDSISYLKLLKAEKISSDSIWVKVIDEKDEYVGGIGCLLFKDQTFIQGKETSLDEGICKFENIKFDRIGLMSFGERFFYDVENANYNYYFFEFKHNPFAKYYIKFKDKRLKIKGKRLLDLSIQKTYVKQKAF